MSEIERGKKWAGRCHKCNTVWWWPKEGHSYKRDIFLSPQCPTCCEPLFRTTPDLIKQRKDRETTRSVVGLDEKCHHQWLKVGHWHGKDDEGLEAGGPIGRCDVCTAKGYFNSFELGEIPEQIQIPFD